MMKNQEYFQFAKSESVKDYLLGKDLSTGLLAIEVLSYTLKTLLSICQKKKRKDLVRVPIMIFFRLTAEVMPINTLIMLHLIMQYLLQTDVIQIALCVRLLSLYEKTARIITVMNL